MSMMKTIKILSISLLLFLAAYAKGQTSDGSFAIIPAPKSGENVATFAGGCFWAMQECMSELKGVNKVISGYAGGTTPNPSYQEVGSLKTGHAESVQVFYDPKVISFPKLVEAFLYSHDPTQLNRQGPDIGTDYRSIAFYRTPEEKQQIERAIDKVNASNHYKAKIVTQVVPFKAIYPAESYHQGYYRLHPDEPYIQSVSEPKVMKLRAAMPDLIKPQFK
jgi:peptide-methionine (S)-S-oxide reductase